MSWARLYKHSFESVLIENCWCLFTCIYANETLENKILKKLNGTAVQYLKKFGSSNLIRLYIMWLNLFLAGNYTDRFDFYFSSTHFLL